jgi:hypothetical protein
MATLVWLASNAVLCLVSTRLIESLVEMACGDDTRPG